MWVCYLILLYYAKRDNWPLAFHQGSQANIMRTCMQISSWSEWGSPRISFCTNIINLPAQYQVQKQFYHIHSSSIHKSEITSGQDMKGGLFN